MNILQQMVLWVCENVDVIAGLHYAHMALETHQQHVDCFRSVWLPVHAGVLLQ